MPHHKAYKKSMRKDEEARLQNRSYRAKMRAVIRNVRQSQNKTAAQENLKKAIVVLDRLARKGIIHQNNAANQKSRLSQFIKTLPA